VARSDIGETQAGEPLFPPSTLESIETDHNCVGVEFGRHGWRRKGTKLPPKAWRSVKGAQWVTLFVEAFGVQGASRWRDEAENREGDQGRNSGLHGTFSSGWPAPGLRRSVIAGLTGIAA
jgi:hypothetical protein